MSTTTTTTTKTNRRGRRVERRILAGDGTTIAVTDWACPKADRTVVFLHGLCLSQGSWSIQRRHILRRYGPHTRIISYDHRGHGGSGSAHTTTYRIDQLAADLHSVLAALNVRGPVVLVGHSMGAMTALTYMAQGTPTAEVTGLVLCAAAAGDLSTHGVGRLLELPAIESLISALTHVPAAATGAITTPARLALRRMRNVGGVRTAAVTQVVSDALETTPLSTAVGYLATLRDFDLTHALNRITVPTTIISGGVDLLTPPVLAQTMAAALPRAHHIHLPTSGHMLPQMDARTVTEAIADMVAAAAPMRRRTRPAIAS
jgi:pimeloyl-ACP methyl ester carboxylesterase